MKPLILALFIIASVSLYLQADGKRRILEEAGKNSAADNQSKDNPYKSTTYADPVTGSLPGSTKANSNGTTSIENNKDGEQKNDSYGAYGNPSGPSTDTHHVFPDDHRPPH